MPNHRLVPGLWSISELPYGRGWGPCAPTCAADRAHMPFDIGQSPRLSDVGSPIVTFERRGREISSTSLSRFIRSSLMSEQRSIQDLQDWSTPEQRELAIYQQKSPRTDLLNVECAQFCSPMLCVAKWPLTKRHHLASRSRRIAAPMTVRQQTDWQSALSSERCLKCPRPKG